MERFRSFCFWLVPTSEPVRMVSCWRVVICCLFFLAALPAKGGAPILVDTNFRREVIAQQADLYRSPFLREPFAAVVATADFQPVQRAGMSFPQRKATYWVRVQLANTTDQARQLIWEIGAADIDQAQLFVMRSEGVADSSVLMGDQHPFRVRPLAYRLLAFPFNLAPGETVTVYAYAEKYNQTITLPLSLWERDAYLGRVAREELFTGVILTVASILFFAGLLLLWLQPSSVAKAFFLYAFAACLYVVHDRGLGGQFLWPDLPVVGNMLRVPIFALVLIALLYFTQALLKDRSKLPAWYRFVDVVIVVLICAIVVAPLDQLYPDFIHALFPFFVFVETAAVIALLGLPLYHFYRFRHRRTLLLFLLFVGTLAAAIVGILANGAGWDVDAFLLRNVGYFGMLLDGSVFLGLLTSDQYRVRRERERLTKDLVLSREQAVENLLRGQQEERGRLARQLHDGLGVLLASIKMRVSFLFDTEEHDRKDLAEGVLADLSRLAVDLRNFSHDLAPVALEQSGLLPALGDMVTKLDQLWPDVTIQLTTPITATDSLTKTEEEALYFVALELLQNSLKHAAASQIEVTLRFVNKQLELGVRDDGKGYDLNTAVSSGGQGLTNVRLRAKLLMADFQVLPHPEQGVLHYFTFTPSLMRTPAE